MLIFSGESDIIFEEIRNEDRIDGKERRKEIRSKERRKLP